MVKCVRGILGSILFARFKNKTSEPMLQLACFYGLQRRNSVSVVLSAIAAPLFPHFYTVVCVLKGLLWDPFFSSLLDFLLSFRLRKPSCTSAVSARVRGGAGLALSCSQSRNDAYRGGARNGRKQRVCPRAQYRRYRRLAVRHSVSRLAPFFTYSIVFGRKTVARATL